MQPILIVDLSTHETREFVVPEDWERDYLGAASLGARILFDLLTPEVDPFSPQAPLLFLTGPLTGTAGPAVGRFVVCGRSPATGLWTESNCGGFWGTELRRTGFDGLLVTGQAEKPVYLWVNNGAVEIRDASALWGKTIDQTQESIQEQANGRKPRVASIGPAGEQRIPFASILTDHGRAAGRTGLGAVMGAKYLKAVAVSGSAQPPIYHHREYARLRARANRLLKDDNFSRTARELGTAGIADYADYLGEMPKQYFETATFDGVDKVTGTTMSETILTGVSACHACVIACGRVVQEEGASMPGKGPEYETLVGFGPNLKIDDLAFITRIGRRCDQLGVDTISMSNVIGFAFHLFEQGVITTADTGGLRLQWGDVEAVTQLVEQTVQREGIGAWLAEGAQALGQRFDLPEQAVQVNGLEMPYHDPRGASGMALVYATSPRGACHNQSDYFLVDLFGMIEERLGMKFFHRQEGAEKAANVALHQDWRSVFNALVMCYFANIPPVMVRDLVNAATGREYTLEDLLQVGERAWNLKRLLNNRFGVDRQNDTLPKAVLRAFADGGSAGYHIPFAAMLEAYYTARGWDPATGYPTPEKLEELGLGWAAA